MAELKITGMAEFEANLRALDVAFQRKALIEVANAGADILVEAARAMAPRDSGAMADGIKKRVSGKETDLHEATVNVGPDGRQFYSVFVEKGTKERFFKHGRKGSSGRMPAHPFLGPALELNRERMAEAMIRKMQDFLERFK